MAGQETWTHETGEIVALPYSSGQKKKEETGDDTTDDEEEDDAGQ